MTTPSSLVIEAFTDDTSAQAFVEEFLRDKAPRYVLGCNAWAASIAEAIDIDGFINDYDSTTSFCGKPVVNSSSLPIDALIVSSVVGVKPLTALARIRELRRRGLDYFSFQKYSQLPLRQVPFIGEFNSDFQRNQTKYEKLYTVLADSESKEILAKLINFRLSRQLRFMNGFTDAQYRQYFEPFLSLKPKGESFVDIGCYDGSTSEEFIKRCPSYEAIHIFEPEPVNMKQVKSRLGNYERIHYHSFGASNQTGILRFRSDGSSSCITEDGDLEVLVRRLDDLVNAPFTFLKMDIEGAEASALEGARECIQRFHPRLAIASYHKASDLWKIPELIFSIRSDYDLYLRHYTEGVTETVLFFMPKQSIR